MNIIGSNLKLLWERITFSRLTTIYFAFSIVHCLIQVIFQAQAFAINAQAASFLYSILIQGNATDPNGFTVLGKQDLRLCNNVPSSFSTSSCRVLWNGTALNDNVVFSNSTAFKAVADPTSSTTLSHSTTLTSASGVLTAVPTQNVAPTGNTLKPNTNDVNNANAVTKTILTTPTTVAFGDGDGNEKRDQYATPSGVVHVRINGIGFNNRDVTLDRTCLWALNYPVAILRNTKREDVTFIAFQFWVLCMSIVAIMNESIPHTVASLLTHMIATAWAGFQIVHTASFKADFNRLSTNGACNKVNFLPQYWNERRNAEITSLAFNVAALLTSAFLTWRLMKLFGWQTFKRVGASLTINRIYKLVLILSIIIQLALFFMVVSLALWLDQLWNGQIAHLASRAYVYKPVFIVVIILLVPWLTTGWFGVRRELRIPTLVFLVLSFGYLLGWGAMFTSTTFRWTFAQWRFFSLIASSSVLLTLVALILGLVCRLNFGKGLLRYLSAQELIPDERIPDPYTSQEGEYDPEKVDFPSNADAIPTFSAAFGSGDEVPPPSQMFAGRQRGPRFFSESTEPFERQTGAYVATGPATHGRSPSSGSVGLERDVPHSSLARQDSQSSQRSANSLDSRSQTTVGRNNSQSSQKSGMSSNSKRWVIE